MMLSILSSPISRTMSAFPSSPSRAASSQVVSVKSAMVSVDAAGGGWMGGLRQMVRK